MSTSTPGFLDDQNLLTEHATEELVRRAAILQCECPRHLVDILRSIREFQTYEKNCKVNSPKDADTHDWLYQSAINLDRMLSQTIIQLARLENMIDDQNQIIDHPKK